MEIEKLQSNALIHPIHPVSGMTRGVQQIQGRHPPSGSWKHVELRHWCLMDDSLLVFRLLRWWYYRVCRGYIVLPANVKPHVIAAVFNMETPIDGAEQGQIQVDAKVIVDRRVILHHVIAKRAVALGCLLLLPVLPYHPGLCGIDPHNGIWFHQTIQSNHRCTSIPIISVHGNDGSRSRDT